MQSKSTRPDRRRFLKRLGMVTGAGALLAMGARSTTHADTDADANTAQARQGQGYRLTPHIRSYYEKAGL